MGWVRSKLPELLSIEKSAQPVGYFHCLQKAMAQQVLLLSPVPPICCSPQAQVMRGAPACVTRRLRATKGWCKAELHQQISCTACPVLLVSSSHLERGLEPSREGAAWCWGPPPRHSQWSPGTPSIHGGPSSSTTHTEPALHRAFFTPRTTQNFLHCPQGWRAHAASCSATSQTQTLHEKLGVGCQQLPGLRELMWISWDAAFVCANHLSAQQVPNNGYELSPQEKQT